MRKGLILYVTDGKEQFRTEDRQDWSVSPGTTAFSAACAATSEEEITYHWWRLVAKGMQEVSCVKARYDAVGNKLEPHGVPLRLCG